MSYARVIDDTIISLDYPPDLLEPDDLTAAGRWWDLRVHANSTTFWETDIIGPHGWLPVTAVPRPPDTETSTFDYSVEMSNGRPTEVWTERPWTQAELDAQEHADNAAQMVAASDPAVDKLIASINKLNTITAATNATINANPAAYIKDIARECKTIARQLNHEARLTSGRTEDTDTGPIIDV